MTAFWAFAPAWILLATGLGVMLLELWVPRREAVVGATLAGLAGAFLAGVERFADPPMVWQGLLVSDAWSRSWALVFTGLAGLVVLSSDVFQREKRVHRGEVTYLVVFAAFAMSLVAASADLMVLFIALETVSLASYALIAQVRHAEGSMEAGIKYILLGAFGSAILVMGIALYFGVTGTTRLDPATWQPVNEFRRAGWILSAVFILAGLGFKVACAPFHMYAPDVYQGAPGPISGFLAGASKAASFLALWMISSVWLVPPPGDLPLPTGFFVGLEGDRELLRNLVRVLAGVTMVWGTLMGVIQTEVKRILAYSSIAHSGYVLLALLVAPDRAGMVLSFYLMVYAVMKIGAFVSVSAEEARRGEHLRLEDLSSLRREAPHVCAALAVFLFALAGMPPTGGFLAKFFLFREAVLAGEVPLVTLAVVTSVAAAAFYLKITVAMFFSEPTAVAMPRRAGGMLSIVTVAAAVLVLAFGIFPGLARTLVP
ncbi:MAG: NADH-quinone oxidoreductase subunit N [Nitrospirae bacterium]|nr:NADH-quinone oxidoreductase subunit N [Nitrospirota bacterium]